MKKISSLSITFVLSAALLLGACGQSAGAVSDASPDRSTSEQTGSLSAQTGTAQTAATQTSAAQTEAAQTGASDLFTGRELDPSYDEGTAVRITLSDSGAACDGAGVSVSGGKVTITDEGVYLLSGTLSNGSVIVDAEKTDKIQLVLDGASVTSADFAALYVKQADKVFVTLAAGSENTLANGGSFTQVDENNVDAAVFSKDDLCFNGTGSLTVSSPAGSGVVCKDALTVTGGAYEIEAANNAIRAKDSIAVAGGSFVLTAGDDGLHAENADDETLGNIFITGGSFTVKAVDDAIHATALLQIDGGSFELTAAEGLESTSITINDGEISISASDDGVNAANKSAAYRPTVQINGGTLRIVMAAGDTDGVDSNGDLIINGGTVDITGPFAFDVDGTAQYNGGTIIVNGQTVNSIPNQGMGGGQPTGFGGMGRGGFDGMTPPDGQTPPDMGGGGRGGQGPGGRY